MRLLRGSPRPGWSCNARQDTTGPFLGGRDRSRYVLALSASLPPRWDTPPGGASQQAGILRLSLTLV